ncbi:electron transfer flavoprotein alpha/ beta subunit (plasmid) [Rhodococcus jostii RHA1]|uniref:Electron transfer flavoprotein small subunit n=1 Tax=Rhodococcus jostii (strain RHA1) TaxID=101510 RepID=Q0RXX6_RHOJR|nr:FAD-binding protein [Rhodococcus jostii]ABG99860.1 electron transfer flavoprotein alpha/ beta subunit [Rhodococcus jostii RHA1]
MDMNEHSKPLRILVCVKQVPVAAMLEFDQETGTMRRDGVPSEVNSFDARALLAALELRERTGGSVVAITMGPPAAEEALRYCLALGADEAIHLSDPAFAGADTLATARALALAVGRAPHDLVMCGRSSTDAETGNIGPQLAELLCLPQITNVSGFDLVENSSTLRATRNTEDGHEVVQVQLPAVLTVSEDVAHERFPSRSQREAVAERSVNVVRAQDLTEDLSVLGSAGSPTRVARVMATEVKRVGTILEEDDPAEQVSAIVDWLTVNDVLVDDALSTREQVLPDDVREREASVCVYAEIAPGGIRRVSLELLGKAVELAHALEAEVIAVAVGANAGEYASELGYYGADRVVIADHPAFAQYSSERFCSALETVLTTVEPRVMLFPSTVQGRDLAPRLAARRGLGLTADCVDLEMDPEGFLVQHKPAFGDALVAHILSSTFPQMASVRPGILPLPTPNRSRRVGVEAIEVPDLPSATVEILETVRLPDLQGHDLDGAAVVVGVGMGATSPAALDQARELADALGAALGCTRKVADEGILPRQTQIGLTGRAVSPRLFVALGSRGAFEHVVGFGRANYVLAVDSDEDSMIFDHADIGAVQRCELLVPLLIDAVRQAQAQTSPKSKESACTSA